MKNTKNLSLQKRFPKRGVVFIGGEAPPPERCREIAAGADVIVAADSGLVIAENAGFRPDWIAGDMDSLSALCGKMDCAARLAAYPPERVLRYSRDKDLTDTEIAVKLLFGELPDIKTGDVCEKVDIIGGGGGRLAHTLAIAALFDIAADSVDGKVLSGWFTSREEIILVRDELRLAIKIGTVISIFPAGSGPWEAHSEGLKWPLDAVKWRRGVHGTSNRANKKDIFIRVKSGAFLVMQEPLVSV